MSDGRLASGSEEGTIRLWDLTTSTESPCLEGHTGSVFAVMPNGRLVSGSYDRTIRLWDVAAQRELTRLDVDSAVHCLAILAEARLVAGDSPGLLHWLEILY
jgi:WD40 repeat protein